MSFRQTGLSDERRRRVRLDDRSAAERAAGTTRSRRSKSGRGVTGYSSAAREENLPRITDFIPTRQFTLFMWMLAGLAVVAGLQSAYGALDSLRPLLKPSGAAPFDFASRGNLASWFSSAVLMIAAFLALAIFNIRRFKENDYRGVYRLWLTAASLLVIASVDAAVAWRHTLGRILTLCAGIPIRGDGEIWVVVLLGPIALAIFVRLLIEIRVSRAASSSTFVAGFAYLSAFAAYTNYWRIADRSYQTMLVCCSLMIGHLFLCLATATYFRYVFLDAQGRLHRRAATTKAQSKAAKEAMEDDVPDDDSEPAENEAASPQTSGRSGNPRAGESSTASNSSNVGASLRRNELQTTTRTSNQTAAQGNQRRDENTESRGSNMLQRMLSKSDKKKLKKDPPQESQRRAA